MKISHVHCGVRDLAAAAGWFQQVLQAVPVFNNERMAWLGFGEFGVILDTASADTVVTLGFDSDDCDADYKALISRGAETIEAPQDRPWGARSAYLKGPGKVRVEIEQVLKRV
ncbi:MAG TPA: VOC family protein [Candidatus Angelobacter sp.]|nr:VOC family protein [Candidatus Angelobacter sp.]